MRFKVTGSHTFPFDMLRYDSCWPATEGDSYRLSDYNKRTIELATDNKHITPSRWSSFMWQVENAP